MLACAVAAGAHAGLVPEHLRSEPRLGAAFIVAVALLLTGGLAVAARPHDRRSAQAVALLFAGLIAAYTASRTTGIPLLDPEPEAVEAVGTITTVVETLGMLLALWLAQPPRRHGRRPTHLEVSR